MKLEDLFEQARGTYAGIRYDTPSKRAIHKYISENKLPNAIRPDKVHTTLLYSRKHLPNYKPAGPISLTCHPKGFTVFQTRGEGPSTKALVLLLDCPELVKRHKELMAEHGATYDFPTYEPHITFSYDLGDIDYTKLPAFTTPLHAVEEYAEDLDLNWATTKGVKKGG